MKNKLPICVDLDGTLIKSDVTKIATHQFIKQNFLNCFSLFFWMLKGIAYFKQQLANHINIAPATLEYNTSFLDYLIAQKANGSKLFLATACNKKYAEEIANFLNLFDGVFASDEKINLRAQKKADTLILMFGEKGFIYAGNSKDDIKVWNKSAKCIMVNPTKDALNGMKTKEYVLFN